MGVPAFFAWLAKKYATVIVPCVEEKPIIINGVLQQFDYSKANPNEEIDNLYLDMNSIIHHCSHPEYKTAPETEDDILLSIFEYLDSIFRITRPRRLIYLAIDGVCPKAKRNQQRSRRFRFAKENSEKEALLKRVGDDLQKKGIKLLPQKSKEHHFDSNCITPGTKFMSRLSDCLSYYIKDRIKSNFGWSNINIILSDSSVPGEGEHKIMDFIRSQKKLSHYDPNTTHCIYGPDADLIMLGLITHEKYVSIIREEMRPYQPKPCELCGQYGHEFKKCNGAPEEKREKKEPLKSDVKFLFLKLNRLRECLTKLLAMDNLPFQFDFQRVLDDFIFLCIFIGNDFLPKLPSLEISEGAIERLVKIYKKVVYQTKGFITMHGQVELRKVQLILSELGKVENEIFKRRHKDNVALKARQKKKKQMKEDCNRNTKPGTSSYLPTSKTGAKRKREIEEESESEPEDDIQLWQEGWKERYYEKKFQVQRDDLQFRKKVATAYAEGLSWVFKYYFLGCPSWDWFFPYNYPPFASDFENIQDLEINFEKGEPINPMAQLMSVLPPGSRQLVPTSFATLMYKPDSPLKEIYPENFRIDLNGKKYTWQGVTILPFIDETKLLKALEPLYPLLTAEEKKRNVLSFDKIYIGKLHRGYAFLSRLYEEGSNRNLELDPKLFSGLRGSILISEDVINLNERIESPINALPNLKKNSTICCFFFNPENSK